MLSSADRELELSFNERASGDYLNAHVLAVLAYGIYAVIFGVTLGQMGKCVFGQSSTRLTGDQCHALDGCGSG